MLFSRQTTRIPGLSHSERVANRQVLIEPMVAAVHRYIGATKDLQAAFKQVVNYRVRRLVSSAAQNILNSAESTDVLVQACINQSATFDRLLQKHWPGEQVRQHRRCLLCLSLEIVSFTHAVGSRC